VAGREQCTGLRQEVYHQAKLRGKLRRYLIFFGGDADRAMAAYVDNMRLAEALMTMLGVLEISLRNGLHRRLSITCGRPDWWEIWHGDPDLRWQTSEVASARSKLQRRAEAFTPDKIVAELPFGFWTSLFNVLLQDRLWKDLRLVFPRCPKPQRQRHTIAAALNQIRNLRNRVFHHEQLLWLTPPLPVIHAKGTEVISWLDPRLVTWMETFDRFPTCWMTLQPSFNP
jgi:hypothetical protein